MRYAQVNYLMDVIMPQCKNSNAFKVISIIARETWGRKNAEWVDLSYADLLEKTGIKTVNTLKVAIADADPFVEQRPKDNQGFIYKMKTVSNIDIVEAETVSNSTISNNDTVSEIDTELYQDLIGTVSEFDTATSSTASKEKKELNNISPPTPPDDEIEVERPEPYKPKYLHWLPVPLQSERGKDTWAMWEEYRFGLGKYQEQSIRAQLKELGEWGIERAEAAVKHSIKQGYKGIYEPNGTSKNGHKSRLPENQQFVGGAL